MLATISAGRSEGLLQAGSSAAEALTGGYHLAFWIAGALVVAAIGIAVTVLKQEPAGDNADAELDELVKASANVT